MKERNGFNLYNREYDAIMSDNKKSRDRRFRGKIRQGFGRVDKVSNTSIKWRTLEQDDLIESCKMIDVE